MISKDEYIAIATSNPNFAAARKILSSNGTDFKRCSCSNAVIDRLMKDADKTEIINFVKEANRLEVDIESLIGETIKKKIYKDKLEQFFTHFENNINKKRLYILVGETGVGKSYMVEKRYPTLPIYPCSKALDPYSLCYDLADPDGKGLRPFETPFLKAVKYGGGVILDEVNSSPHDLLMLLQGLTDEKETIVIGHEVIKIHPNFKIMATMNPPSETDDRTPLGDALLGRAIGHVIEMTDELIMTRLGVTSAWLNNVRILFNFIRNAAMTDVRDLNFRDYQKFSDPDLDFEEQLKFKICVNDVGNISAYKKIQATGEYQNTIKKIYAEMI